MIPKDYKRLAEMDFPIAQVSKHAAREKCGGGLGRDANRVIEVWEKHERPPPGRP